MWEADSGQKLLFKKNCGTIWAFHQNFLSAVILSELSHRDMFNDELCGLTVASHGADVCDGRTEAKHVCDGSPQHQAG